MITMQPKHSENYSSGQEKRGLSSNLSYCNKYSSHPFPNFAISSHHEVDWSEPCPIKLSEGKEIPVRLYWLYCKNVAGRLCALDYDENFFLHSIQLHLSVAMLHLSQP